MKRQLSDVASLLIAFCVVTGCGRFEPDPYDLDFDIPRSEDFAQSLLAYGLYEEPLSSLQPAERAIRYELSSELFTDYAFKQRLLMVPEGSSIAIADSTTLQFPEGTVLAKTFYYPSDMRDAAGPAKVIETRLLIKTGELWNVATYLWNAEQTDAALLLDGTTTDVAWIDERGQPWTTEYAVPHEGECVTCHQSGESSAFIGPTLRNLNRTVARSGNEVNQLEYLRSQGVLNGGDWASTPTIPNYRDIDISLEHRSRAYLDINCAHCHNPDGWDESSRRDLDFRFETPLSQTGVLREARALRRHLENGDMPFLGTTLKHEDGVRLVLDYVDSL